MAKTKSSWRIIFHSLGLGCLCGSVVLQMLVFLGILQQGYFIAVEQNQLILSFEMFLTLFSFIYFIHIYQRFMRSVEKPVSLSQ